MSNTAQKRALRNYRTRLAKRGMARFEVLGLGADRDLIRSLAKRLAEDDPDAVRIRAAVDPDDLRRTAKEGRHPHRAAALAAGSRSALDMIVAAVGEANGCVVVTDNEKVTGLKFVNPLRARAD